jgi:hypothetical protein
MMAGINVGRLKDIQIIVPTMEIQNRLELLRNHIAGAVWKKNQRQAKCSRELINALSAKFFSNCEAESAIT